jgi:hypothetical protein
MVAAEAQKRRRGGTSPGKKKLITFEAGICMKTNKTTTICPAKRATFLQNKWTSCAEARDFRHKSTVFLIFLEQFAMNSTLQMIEAGGWREAPGGGACLTVFCKTQEMKVHPEKSNQINTGTVQVTF